MRFPWRLNYDLTKYIIKNNLNKVEKYPLVLMLEPTHLCNLTCSGCGRIREYANTINDMIRWRLHESVDECPHRGHHTVVSRSSTPTSRTGQGYLTVAVTSCSAPIVLMEESIKKMQPHPNLTFNVHMDGLEQTHDRILERKGCFKTGMAAIKAAKAKGFRVCTNTTIFTDTDLVEIEMLFQQLEELGVDGILVAPGFSYEAVEEEKQSWYAWRLKRVPQDYEMSKKHRFGPPRCTCAS